MQILEAQIAKKLAQIAAIDDRPHLIETGASLVAVGTAGATLDEIASIFPINARYRLNVIGGVLGALQRHGFATVLKGRWFLDIPEIRTPGNISAWAMLHAQNLDDVHSAARNALGIEKNFSWCDAARVAKALAAITQNTPAVQHLPEVGAELIAADWPAVMADTIVSNTGCTPELVQKALDCFKSWGVAVHLHPYEGKWRFLRDKVLEGKWKTS